MDQLVERWAMKLAVGNNGGVWDSHYTEKHKALWRERAREFIEECRAELVPTSLQACNYGACHD
jgi:hypothetical protein